MKSSQIRILAIVPKYGTIVLNMSTNSSIERLGDVLLPGARGQILGLVFGAPDRAFYLREIVKQTGLAIGQVQRELARLSTAGILRRFHQGRHVYFQANDRCPVYHELRGMVSKTVGAAGAVQRALAPIAGEIAIAFLFGSVARQTENHESDLDLMVIGDAIFAAVVAAVRAEEPVVQREIHPTVYPAREFVVKFRDGNHFVRSVAKSEKIFLIGTDDELRELLAQQVDSAT
jgi:predicted nucleotidyltransferase